MNLVLSGPIDENLRNHIAGLVAPRAVVRLHERAYRFEGALDTTEVRTIVEATCDGVRVDHAYVEEGKKLSDFKLLAMDMDSTLITIECIDEIADFAGKKEEVAAITEAAMRGEITDFSESLRRRVSLLRGAHVKILERTYNERLSFSPGARKLFDSLITARTKTMLISGGFSYFSDRVKESLSIDYSASNTLEIIDERITGAMLGPIIDGAAKASILKDTASSLKVERSAIIAIGDGANDVAMLKEAGFSIAYHAKEVVRTHTTYRINFSGLDTVCDWLPIL